MEKRIQIQIRHENVGASSQKVTCSSLAKNKVHMRSGARAACRFRLQLDILKVD